MSDLYVQSCSPVTESMRCGDCARDTAHMSQSRLCSVPNVLVVQIVRNEGARPEICVEEEFEAPGVPAMDLVGVVYHNGTTVKSGHYTCLCRGPSGRFWYYDDEKAVVRMDKDVGHVKPRAVYMAVYCRKGGVGVWQERAGADGVDVDVASSCDGSEGGGGDGSASGGPGGGGAGGPSGASPHAQTGRGGSGRCLGVGAELSRKRRLSRKMSATEADERAGTPRRRVSRQVSAEDAGALGSAEAEVRAASPRGLPLVAATPRRRLRRKVSAEDEAAGRGAEADTGAAPSLGSPVLVGTPRRRLSRKMSADDEGVGGVSASPLGRVPVRVRENAEQTARGGAPGGALEGADVGNVVEGRRGMGGLSRSAGRPSRAVDAAFASRASGAAAPEESTLRRSNRLAGRGPDLRAGVAEVRGRASNSAQAPARGARVVSGFGAERIEDVRAHGERVEAEALVRAARRREEGTRARATGFDGEDIDRGAGGAWHAGRR